MNNRLRYIPVVFIFSIVVFSCPLPFLKDNAISNNTNNLSNLRAPKYFWGYWTRMDTGEVYYINDRKVKVISEYSYNQFLSDGIEPYGSEYPISSSTDNMIKFTSYSLQKESDNVAKLGDGILLFRNGGSNLSFIAKLSGFSDTLNKFANSKGASIGMQPIGGRPGTRKNPQNDMDTQTVVSDSNGVLQFTNAVSNSSQVISTTEALPVTVQPLFDGEFVGTIPVVDSGYVFKTSYKVTNLINGYLYGNDYGTYKLDINIQNIGNTDCETSVYYIESEDTNLSIVSGATSGNFSTIEKGKSKTFNFTVSYGTLMDEYKDVTIKIKIIDSSLNPRIWEDYIVLRFYRWPVYLYVTSQNLDGNYYAELKGFVIHPNRKSQRFTCRSGSKTTISFPWSTKPYGLVFSGAGADSEMKYAFSFRDQFPDLSGVWDIDTIISYEPNNSESTKAEVNPTAPIRSYLKKNDIDYFNISLNDLDFNYNYSIVKFFNYALYDSTSLSTKNNYNYKANPGETLYMDMGVQNSGSHAVYNLVATLSSDSNYINIIKNSYNYGYIPAGYYGSGYDSPSYDYPHLRPSSGCFQFSLAQDVPVGTKIPITVIFTDAYSNNWTDTFTITVE